MSQVISEREVGRVVRDSCWWRVERAASWTEILKGLILGEREDMTGYNNRDIGGRNSFLSEQNKVFGRDSLLYMEME